MKEKESIKRVVAEIYHALNETPSSSRLKKNVQIRSAISNSIQETYSRREIGAAVGKDHSTITHYIATHSDNLQFWGGYKEIYESVALVANSYILDRTLGNRIEFITARIESLQREKALLEEKLS